MQQWEGGTRFAGLVIEAPLGRGGMSVLYRAVDPRLDRSVALKVISPELSDDPDFRTRFADEARSASAVEHPHIVPIYSFGEDSGCLYLAMRLINGRDLASIIGSDGPLELTRVDRLLGQVADALDAVHQAGMVHRDVKPANVLVAERDRADGPSEFVYLTDFGLTRSARSSQLTKAGDFVGTVDYASPEQLRGGEVTAASDVYSFAVMLHEAVTGHRPFTRDSDTAVMYAQAFEPPPLVSWLRPGLPAGLDAVVCSGLAKAPADRYPSCGALMVAYRDAIAGAPVELSSAGSPTIVRERDHAIEAAPTVAPRGRDEPVAERRRGRAVAVVVATFALVAVVIAGSVELLTRRSDPSQASPDNRPAFTAAVPQGPVSEAGPVTSVDGVEVRRQLDVDPARPTELDMTISFRNTTSSTVRVEHVEVIDKDQISDVTNMTIRTEGVTVVEPDPVISWTTTIPPGGTARLQYSSAIIPPFDAQSAFAILDAQSTAERSWFDARPDQGAATRVRPP
ncbi:MAG: serine/threonine protein kinase [Actinobacteria bacterium]|nr:serine/threonine protein kinase [Actinomycetota bacterium]